MSPHQVLQLTIEMIESSAGYDEINLSLLLAFLVFAVEMSLSLVLLSGEERSSTV